MKKRILALMLILVLCFAFFVACDTDTDDGTDGEEIPEETDIFEKIEFISNGILELDIFTGVEAEDATASQAFKTLSNQLVEVSQSEIVSVLDIMEQNGAVEANSVNANAVQTLCIVKLAAKITNDAAKEKEEFLDENFVAPLMENGGLFYYKISFDSDVVHFQIILDYAGDGSACQLIDVYFTYANENDFLISIYSAILIAEQQPQPMVLIVYSGNEYFVNDQFDRDELFVFDLVNNRHSVLAECSSVNGLNEFRNGLLEDLKIEFTNELYEGLATDPETKDYIINDMMIEYMVEVMN